MNSFWRLAKEMLHWRGTLIWAMVFAFLSAAGLGVGLLSVVPMLEILLGGEAARSLAEVASEHNADDPAVRVPDWLMGRLPADPRMSIAWVLAVLAVLTIFGGIANFLHMQLTGTVAAKTVGRIRAQAFEHAVYAPLGKVIARGPSEFIARIVRDAAELQRGFLALTSKSVAQLTKALAALIVAILIQPVLTLVTIPTAVVLAIILRKIGKRVRRGTRGSLQAQERLLRISSEALQGLRAVKSSTGEPDMVRRFGEVNDEVVHHELRVRTARAASAPLVESLAVFAILILVYVAANLIINGSLDPQRFLSALIALGVAGGALRPLAGLVTEIQAASAPAGRLREVLDEGSEEASDPRRPKLPRHSRSIDFAEVSYTYPGGGRPALRDISLHIAHGERVAIVGPNGSGKTTLVSMLPRLLNPTSGQILVDEFDIATVGLSSLRRQIGVVTQETVLFRASVAENIAFGMDDVTRDAIIDAAKQARADQFIQQLRGGYDADLAEQGASLSGGQRQRIAIARAILRNPSILILDEATSQIDAESEAQINDALREFCRERTALLIAHRLATVLNADRIIVMEDGAIVAEGGHDELLDRCDLYHRLARTQLVEAR